MRKAISKTEFMKFEVDGSSVQAAERELGVAEDQLWAPVDITFQVMCDASQASQIYQRF